jgi:hypothetical protein
VTGVVGPAPMAYRVAAVGPLFSGKAADVGVDAATGWPQPHFGAFWRVHLAVLPATGGAFDRDEHAGVSVPAGMDIRDYQGRVALDTACFNEPTFPGGCTWLDSQAKIESILGASAIVPTQIMGTCPFVFYDKKPVKR